MREPPLVHVPRPKAALQPTESASIRDVMASFQVLKSSVLELFDATGVDPTKTRELARELGLNRGLAWKLSRVARSIDGTDVAHDVPGRQSMEHFIRVCQERGVKSSLISKATDATDAFEESVSSCSGGRKTLSMLLANRVGQTSQLDRERARRTLFEGACAVWGVQAQTRFVTVFLFPSKDTPGHLDAAHVTGHVGFRQLSSRPWPMSYEAVHDSDGESVPIIKEPLDPDGSEEGELQIIREFCEPDVPNIVVRKQKDYKTFELAAGQVGNKGMTTVVFGSYLKALYMQHYNRPETAGFMVLLQTPVERVIFDYYVHKDVQTQGKVITHLLDRMTYPHENREEDFDHQSMTISETPRDLPQGIHGASTPHLPWYPRLLELVTDRIGLDYDDFVGSRFMMSYPPISTTLSMRVSLKPNSDA